jgi:hypothetical protein
MLREKYRGGGKITSIGRVCTHEEVREVFKAAGGKEKRMQRKVRETLTLCICEVLLSCGV